MKHKKIIVNSITELINELSNYNDRIGDFLTINWLISKCNNFIIEIPSELVIIELINKPVETDNEQLEYLCKEELAIINNALNKCHGDKEQISMMMRKLYQIAIKPS